MPQSLSKVLLHVVFSTKNREKTIPRHLRAALHAYLAGVCRAKGAEAFRVGGTDDHVHLACSLPRTLTMAKLIEEIKKPSSTWMKGQDGGSSHFSLQAGYGIFSVGQSQFSTLLHYIDNQEEHHSKPSALHWAGMEPPLRGSIGPHPSGHHPVETEPFYMVTDPWF